MKLLKTILSKIRKKLSKKSFTLIELLIAIAIVGLLVSIVLVSLQGATASARDGKRDTEAGETNSTLRKALEVYHSANGVYPFSTTSESDEGCCIEEDDTIKDAIRPYISSIPQDPLYNLTDPDGLDKYCYRYKTINNGEEYKIRINYEKGGIKEVASWGGETILYNTWLCGDEIAFTYKGNLVTYGTVSHNNECWLDRNLGASQQATAYNDSAAYGDMFQWGRIDDQHQNRSSVTTSTNSSNNNPGHDNFILELGLPYDWRVPQNDNLWQGIDGINNPCPNDWRIPTDIEWETERLSWISSNTAGAFASPLKLSAGGYRARDNGLIHSTGNGGYYWSSTISDTNALYLLFGNYSARMNGDHRALGVAVRCIKD
ncbi:MAG: FISUMP domain-containing protein [bacterium]